MKQIFLAFLFLVVAPVFAGLAWSQTIACFKKNEFLAGLKQAGQAPVFVGLSIQGTMTQIWFDPEKQKYSIITIPPQGEAACVLDMGGDGEFQPPKLGSPM